MNDTPTAPDLRPLGVGETLDAAFRILRQNFGSFVKISVAFMTPLAIALIIYMNSQIQYIGDNGLLYVKNPSEYQPTILLLGLAARLLQLLAFGVLVHLATRLYMNTPHTAASIVRLSSKRLLPFIGLALLLGLYAFSVLVGLTLTASPFGFFGAFIMGAGMITWATFYGLSAPSFWYEEVGARRAIGRSFDLVKGRFWPVLGSIGIAFVIILVFSVGFGALLVAAFTQNVNPLLFVLLTIGSEYFGTIIGVVVLAPIVTVTYFDGRVRNEGFDLQIKLDDSPEIDPTPPQSLPW
ncbi:MAG: hypothetical protein GY926_05705 [bacterium]|nr:hypothetical protein [bacterium]